MRALRERIISSRNSVDCAKLCEMFVEDGDDTVANIIRKADNRASCTPMYPTASTAAAAQTLIIGTNHYKSVRTQLTGCRTSAPPTMCPNLLVPRSNRSPDDGMLCPFDRSKLLERREFHKNFENRIKLGQTDKRASNEIDTWQTELKDLIWLELQAWHAERTPEDQDSFLCDARKHVPLLLETILHYRFKPASVVVFVSNTDSDMDLCDAACEKPHKICMLLCCKNCQQQQCTALFEVEDLLQRLEAAEALYPSSKVMGTCHPMYVDPTFVGRVKAMCLWYNITKDQRLRLALIGKLLFGSSGQWSPNDSTSMVSTEPSSDDDVDLDSGSAYVTSAIAQSICEMQKFLLDPVCRTAAQSKSTEVGDDTQNVSPYRRYIEHIMKSSGLAKSLSFLHRMHNVTVRQVQLTLERQGSEEAEFNAAMFEEDTIDGSYNNEPPLGQEQEEELRRYGVWSPETQSLNLPSYMPTFVFLSVVPLEIMLEYLRMRIDSRPQSPDPLSLGQLLKEVREGLILAMTHRERFNKHVHTALDEQSDALDKYMSILGVYDATVGETMAMYLEYVGDWVLGMTPHGLQKAAIVREWSFTKLIAPMIRGQHSLAALKFCRIVGLLLHNIGERLQSGIDSLMNDHRPLPNPIRKTDVDKAAVLLACREMQSLFTAERENSMRVLHFAKLLCRDLEQKVFHRDHEEFGGDEASSEPTDEVVCPDVKTAAGILQHEVIRVRHSLTLIVKRVQSECTADKMTAWEETDCVVALKLREILHQSFKFVFDYHNEQERLLETRIMSHHVHSFDVSVSLDIIEFARMWMVFATTICERGRGVKPRWATQGLEFLIGACNQVNTKHLTQVEFERLKVDMDACIAHVIGEESATKVINGSGRRPSTASNRPSPQIRSTRTPSPCFLGVEHRKLKQQRSASDRLLDGVDSSSIAPGSPLLARSRSVIEQGRMCTLKMPRVRGQQASVMRQSRIRETVSKLDTHIDQTMRDLSLIGQVKTLKKGVDIIQVRSVNFRWHRGIKIGQGRFGKVYTAVNVSNGELIAMKEITIQPNDARSIQKVAEELKIFEGISHRYLVKYYGIEVHREELLIFMGLCAEGTLESLIIESGSLHEGLTRRFTAQLLTAVDELHKHGVVHRDVKTANIFLTNGGNCLKLGDFGSAVKIQGQSTVPGELKTYAGTYAYMAPEVFSSMDGYGRAADIWSCGCVAIEMASGKRPWAQFNSNCQIMFKVGINRESPEIPADLSPQGHTFLQHCLQFDARLRWPSYKLLQHNFCKVDIN